MAPLVGVLAVSLAADPVGAAWTGPGAAPGGSLVSGGQGAQQPNATAILRRAAAAYSRVRTLRADFTMQMDNPLLKKKTTSRGVLYQHRPDRILLRFDDPKGDIILGDGQYIWLYYPSVDAKQVLRSHAGARGAGAVDLQAQFLGNPVERFDHQLEGTAEVDGRKTYVLTLVPREDRGYRKLKVWVDAGDSLVRQFEITETSGAVRRFHLTRLAINVTVPDSLFHFTPPAGAHVIDRG